MAAPPSKPSPSNQDVSSSKDDTNSTNVVVSVKNPPPPAAATNEDVVVLKDPPLAEPTYESSEKSTYYVAAKAFLNDGQFEDALTKIEQGIESTRATLQKIGKTEDSISFHESMALFHYMYGTTLLYSIEETADSMAMPSAEGDGVDDAEIAWENFEIARTVMERMVVQNSTSDKLKLDLAQVYLREGDLHRMNGRYTNAVEDYESCLKYREESDSLGPYDRKIADVHYNLGLVHMLLVAEKQNTEGSADDSKPAALDEQAIAAHRGRSFHHYYACGKTLCGQLAFLAGQEPADFFKKVEASVPNFKSTGEEDEGIEHPKVAGMKLESLRKNVAGMQPLAGNADDFHDLKEMLDEIQETIDEADKSEAGVQQVAAMKAELSALVASSGGLPAEAVPQQGGTATSGASGGTSTTSIGFGSAEAAARTAVAQPIMAVKKKKRPAQEDTKMPATDPAKRPKSE